MRVGQDGGVLAGFAQGAGRSLALFGGGLAGVAGLLHPGLGQGWGRAVGPDGVDGIGRQRHQSDAGVACQGGLGMQPWVVADAFARRDFAQPVRRRLLDEVAALPKRGVGLLHHLGGVAAIGEDGRTVSEHDGQAGAAGEAG